jgi:hypothetical protein
MSLIKTKADVINLLIRKYQFTSFLEISVPTTGLRFGEVTSETLERRHRIVYNCPPEFDDGHEVTWRSANTSLDAITKTLPAALRYDVVLVDSFHSHECSARDLRFASSMVSERGLIVMHDAAPPILRATIPDFIEGPWAGQSYAALIDFLLSHPERSVYVVSVDWGVAIIGSPMGKPLGPEVPSQAWRALPDNYEERFTFFVANRKALLNLINWNEFLKREQLQESEPFRSPAAR